MILFEHQKRQHKFGSLSQSIFPFILSIFDFSDTVRYFSNIHIVFECSGSKLESGAKAILMKWKGKKDQSYTYTLFVMSAVKKLDSKRVKTLLGAASLSFAPEEEVKKVRI
jgi:hypothetical protein